MPIYIYCRAHIISNAASIISLQRMDSSSLASFFSANSSRVNQDVFFSLPAPAICVAKVWAVKSYWKSPVGDVLEWPFQVSRKEQSTL